MPHEIGSAPRAGAQTPRATRRRFPAIERRSLYALGLGAASVAGFAPLYLFPLPIVTLALLIWLWRGAESPKRAAVTGWWFGLGFFLVGVSWVYVSLHTFGSMPWPLAAIGTFLFCAYLSVFPAAAGYVFAIVRGPIWLKAAVVTPAAWTLTEWMRGWLFPWIGMGYSQVPVSPLAGYAPVLGIYGVTWIMVLGAALLTLAGEAVLHGRHRAHAAPAVKRSPLLLVPFAAFIVLMLGGHALKQIRWTSPDGEPVSVTLLQGNIPQELKWTHEGLRTTLITYRELALASRSRLIVFPETALPLFLRDVPEDYLESIADHARQNGGDALIGVPERLAGGDYYNTVISLGMSPPQFYRKTHLVPLGEFIPLRPLLGWIVGVLAIPLQDFSRGSTDAQPLAIAGQRVAVDICYEDAFGEEIIRQLPQATILVNVSNVAWFGRSIAPEQHLQISQARALETGRYMLRATNTGMTAVVNERGRVVDVAPQFATATLTSLVQGYVGATPYVRTGNAVILVLCAILLTAGFLYARLRPLKRT
ncbi:MAG TPA: apolipoprotein N-acyltransferase [Burkholderiales bacterium]|nr:apolipoprotein N-acyltransferase [Burkholderiales bacterium]